MTLRFPSRFHFILDFLADLLLQLFYLPRLVGLIRTAVLSSLKAAKDIAEGLFKLGEGEAFKSKFIEFQSKVIDANDAVGRIQEERAALLERIRELEEQVAQFEAWTSEKEKYELKQVAPGAFAYVPKKTVQGAEPSHWLCTTCYERGKKRFLQKGMIASWAQLNYHCAECGSTIPVPSNANPES